MTTRSNARDERPSPPLGRQPPPPLVSRLGYSTVFNMYAKGKGSSVPSDAQAREKLALYVYEYLLHVGAQKAAQTFLSEAAGVREEAVSCRHRLMPLESVL
ncbi:Single-stranded DNA-binding protein 3 [Portunus trituberculatus]|uniref:Single-stranded DNA-binding protein 3 n=1 Tax=Portunus trituberculatus TaxID=210409 RepID=A0A5B7G1Y1_PORTR|nr:Single-stranded DNA-binding protein 3 [Portunus trituberculatus]